MCWEYYSILVLQWTESTYRITIFLWRHPTLLVHELLFVGWRFQVSIELVLRFKVVSMTHFETWFLCFLGVVSFACTHDHRVRITSGQRCFSILTMAFLIQSYWWRNNLVILKIYYYFKKLMTCVLHTLAHGLLPCHLSGTWGSFMWPNNSF